MNHENIYEEIQHELEVERFSKQYLRDTTPTIAVLVQAFPTEIREIIPKVIKILKRSVTAYEKQLKRVRNFHYDDLDREAFELRVTELCQEPKEEIALIKRLEAIKRALDCPESDDSITPDMIAQAKSIPIESLYSFEKIKRFGGRIKALCPFHGEKTPSFVIYLKSSGSASENTFHCFGCGEGRDAIDFYCKIHGLTLHNDFPRAVKELVQHA